MARTIENELEQMRDALMEEIVRAAEGFPEESAPYGMVRLSQEEQIERYMPIRDDEDAWQRIIQERGIADTLDYMETMERLLERRRAAGSVRSDRRLGKFGGAAGNSARDRAESGHDGTRGLATLPSPL